MACTCGSTRFLTVSGKCADMGTYVYEEDDKVLFEQDGYAPFISSVCGGDDINLAICCDCCKVKDLKPLSRDDMDKAFNE